MLVLFSMLIGLAHADTEGDDWLNRIDAAGRIAHAHVELNIQVQDARGRTHERTIEIWQKGDDRRLVRMTAPSRLAGIGLLASPGDQLHMFLPSYPPARRVIGSKRTDAFVGTDFAIEDLSRMTYSTVYTANVTETKDGLTKLTLKHLTDPTPELTHLWVDQAAVIRTVEHTNASGEVTRRLLLSDVRPIGSAQLAHRIEVTDLRRNRVTTAKITSIDTEQDIEDALFSVTTLERP
jgi:outer membrane lipoprotein-sorting protein